MNQQTYDNICYWREVWADNTDPDNVNKGILNFSLQVCADSINPLYGIGQTHKDSYQAFLDLYSNSKRFITERQLQIKEPRGFAKSTRFLHVIPMYLIMFNGSHIKLSSNEKVKLDEGLICLCSETNMFATNWVMSLRANLAINALFKLYAGEMKPSGIRDEGGLWRKDAFIVRKKILQTPYTGRDLTILGRGVGQQIRGLNIGGDRPTLLIFDDIYSKNNTVTPESRQKVRYWFNNEAVNTLDHNKGKAVIVGTMLHEDTVFSDNTSSSDWTCLESPVMDESKFMYVLDNHCSIDRDKKEVIIPDSGECEQLEKQGYVTNWQSKFPLEFLLQKFRGSIQRGDETGLWQEYFHKVIAEADKQIKANMFQRVKIRLLTAKIGGQEIPFIRHELPDGTFIYKNVNITVAIDTAISDKETADNTAIVWVAMTAKREVYVLESRYGKFGIRDNIRSEFLALYNSRKQLVQDKSQLEMIGMVDETFRMIKYFNPYIIVETNKAGTNAFRAFKIACKDFDKRLRLFEFVAKTNKVERILDALLPYYETKTIFHSFGLTSMEHELEILKKAKHDDQADALATAVAHTRPPAEIPFPNSSNKTPEDKRANINKKRRKVYVNEDWTTSHLPMA